MKRTIFYTLIYLLFAAVSAKAQTLETRLTGEPIGSEPVNYGSGPQLQEFAFDGDFSTYYASNGRSNTWVGLDLGEPHVISHIGWVARNGQEQRVQLGVFEGSNEPDFLDAVPLYVIPESASKGKLIVVGCNVSRGFRYVRYVGPSDARCNIAEVAFWGEAGEGDDSSFYQISGIPTLSIHILDGSDPSQNKELERESNMTLTYDNGTRIQEYPMTIRGRGNASWGFEKKPYRIKFNDGKKHHMLKDSPRESPAKAKKWTLLSNEGDKTLMRNLLAHEVSRRLDLPYTVYSEPVDLILNGEYKGLYNLCDQVDENKNRIPITEMDADDVDGDSLTGGYHIEMDAYAGSESARITFNSTRGIPFTIKSPDEDEIQPVQRNYIRQQWNNLETAIWRNGYDDPETGYMKLLDVSSFLRHFLLGEMSGNTDTYYSVHMWKERGEDKFVVSPGWDFDLAFENDSRTYPICNNSNWICLSQGSCAGSSRSMVQRIIEGPNADKMLKQIWAEARKKGLSEESLVAYLDSMETLMTYSAGLNFKRWPILNQLKHMNFQALGSYDKEVNVARQYIIDRVAWIDEKLNYSGGEVYTDSTYYISTPEELVQFAKAVNAGANGSTAHLKADIDLAGVEMPMIGTARKPFHGEFDGGGHRISNFVISGGNNTGFIGSVNGTVYIHDFIMDSSCRISGTNYVGIVGASVENSSKVTIERVGNEANISGNRNVAGIYGCNMGSMANVIIRNCYNTGTINGTVESGALSGWVGSSYDIDGCWNIGEVSGVQREQEMFRYGGWAQSSRIFSTYGTQGQIISSEAVTSGELCWLANNESSDAPVWYQKLGEDAHPNFDFYRGIVYKKEDGTYTNGTFLLGDANVDGKVDQTDMTLVANYIMGRDVEEIDLVNADPNVDGVIDALDLVLIGRLVNGLALVPEQTPVTMAQITAADASLKAGTVKRLSTMLKAEAAQCVYQVDVILPEGVTMDPTTIGRGAALTANHLMDIEPIESGYRVLAYALNNQSMTSSTATAFVLKLDADATFREGMLTLANQRIATSDFHVSRPVDASYKLTLTPTLVTSITPIQTTYELELEDYVTATIEVTVLPETATNKTLRYTSEKPSIASVNEEGLLTPHNLGTTTITIAATDGSNVKTTLMVEVVPGPTAIEGVHADDLSNGGHDMQGLRVDKLQRGKVYIVNGKKIYIK